MPSTVLLIEDDARIRELLPRYLTREGLAVLTAADGAEGLARIAADAPDLVLLDVNLPDTDGWSILRRLRQGEGAETAVIMLTGRSDVPDRLLGLDLGADDYIVKPFDPNEVVARVKAVLRRTHRGAPAEALCYPGMEIDQAGRVVTRDGTPVALTAKEFTLLTTLARRPGRVMSRQALYDAAWGDDGQGDDHTLDVHMNRLRQKLAGADGRAYLVTVRGVGYKFEAPHA
jgi:DNA-binding response OmpR family regulator